MSDADITIQNLPWIELIPLATVTLLGLVMWVAGRRCLRYAFAALGLLIGAAIGTVGSNVVDVGVASWVPAVFMGLILATIAALAYRLAVAATLAIVFGLSGPMLVRIIAEARGVPVAAEHLPEHTPVNAADPPAHLGLQDPWGVDEMDAIDMWIDRRLNRTSSTDEAATDDTPADSAPGDMIPEEAEARLMQARDLGERLTNALRDEWRRTPEVIRPTMIMAAGSGVLLGALLGAVASGIGASLVTSFGGAMLWLGGGRLMLIEFGAPDAMLPDASRTWLIAWLAVSIIGLIIQWTIGHKRADTGT